ncbi:protein POLR1D-like isoform X1 [Pecten maximus]|uniref:protein POLR1D-like isoform X1 n=1 Tax=Pecten maximus TaxID=6579 RepID=UPI001458B831|nr:protein POLR1D-like isoform X1 [Pecten maximus]XP_033742356.1 protein POLR1D-like isoform X1 [Pecten maximus]XP_033742357.1 protein POLR1D-like isoform X1 [Pecten maximus]XP_033742359.1 protein POLR1D-like isoform X1 [Pecten maximus]XP_033742360.1 protein POLR1D-like isoform X1 [Pecten maximus]
MDEEALERLAVEEILKETKRGAERAKEFGALGWQKPAVPSTNKRFLTNMILSSVNDSNRKKRKHSNDRNSPREDNSENKLTIEKDRDSYSHQSEKHNHKKKKKKHRHSDEIPKSKHKHSSKKHKSGHKHKKHHRHRDKVKE